MRFTLEARDPGSRGRAGVLETDRGSVRTPAFMPVGTKAAVKSIPPTALREAGTEIVLSNAYHLSLRPGDRFIQERGGLHKFMGWNGPILTDSGGFQVFSLAKLCRVTDEGAEFRSHLDGSPQLFTPERVLEIQRRLGSTICMPLDEPAPVPGSDADIERAVRRTSKWLERTVRARQGENVFGIVQGGLSAEWRKRSAAETVKHGLPGYAIGGLSLGEPPEALVETTAVTCAELPQDRPRYLMGVGTPGDIVRAVAAGVDLFDCVLPTRMGRTGWAFTSVGMIKIKNAKWKADDTPLDPACACTCCRSFTKAYLRHCFVEDEILGLSMLSLHNIAYYLGLMRRIRDAVISGRLTELADEESRRCPPLSGRKALPGPAHPPGGPFPPAGGP